MQEGRLQIFFSKEIICNNAMMYRDTPVGLAIGHIGKCSVDTSFLLIISEMYVEDKRMKATQLNYKLESCIQKVLFLNPCSSPFPNQP